MEDHDGLRRMMREYAGMMGTSRPDDLSILTSRRIAFSQLFRQHMAREDAMEQAVRADGVGTEGEQVIRDHRDRVRALFLNYSEHIKCWTLGRIDREWAAYRDAVLALQKALSTLMEWEEKMLHPLAGELTGGLKAA